MPWEQWLDAKRMTQQELEELAALPPEACPNDGEPLSQGPDGALFCRFDGWRPA